MKHSRKSDPRAQAHNPDRFKDTRAAHEDETAEDYVEAIADILRSRGEARVSDLSRMMGVSHVTVSRIVTRLVKKGLVQTAPYKPITLTPEGLLLAERARTRHDAVLAFLIAIGVPRSQAEVDAEGIEHHVSDATIKAMTRLTRTLADNPHPRPPRTPRPAQVRKPRP
ncbi:MAG: manganese-binding transcriptional regulator MntR [Phycisphaeraceae bacterium]|nr:manganese-binding transcriptional regulator MntR [Phycisphaeraceae bacterium]